MAQGEDNNNSTIQNDISKVAPLDLPIAESNTLPAIVANKEEITKIRAQISLDDRSSIAVFGDNAQRSVVAYSDKILSQVKNKDMGETGKLLNEIIAKAKGLDPAAVQKKGLLGKLFGNARAEIEKFKGRYDDVAGQIDYISIQLDKRKEELRRDIANLDNLHEETANAITMLTNYIAAGEEFAKEMREQRLPQLRENAQIAATQGDGLIEAQTYKDAEQALDRLEKRVFYLRQARQVGIQQLPQIRIVQSGDETLIESLQATIRLTVPLWKQKMVLLLGLNKQEEALSMLTSVTDATNEMLRQTSSMMKTQAVAIEEQSQRGLVDIETLEQANRDLIDTLAAVLQTQEEGRAKRATIEVRMGQMTEELRQALIAAGKI
jgi:uncharacterized protein YaaN involved in tellurite resistance